MAKICAFHGENDRVVLSVNPRVMPVQIRGLDALNIVLRLEVMTGSFRKKKCFAGDTHPIRSRYIRGNGTTQTQITMTNAAPPAIVKRWKIS